MTKTKRSLCSLAHSGNVILEQANLSRQAKEEVMK